MTHFHMIGIGGAGMSVVARLLAAKGHSVQGSDAQESATLRGLREAGIPAWAGHDAAHVGEGMTVVVSTAIRESNPELARARQLGLPVIHRSVALALAAEGSDLVAVAGAHGKTTTSAMIAVALRHAGLDPSAAIGGTVIGLGSGAHHGSGRAFVAEADESDGSFLNYRPRVAVVTNVEPDHLDHYGTREAFQLAFREFVDRIVPGGLLVACADDPGARDLLEHARATGVRTLAYGTGDDCDVVVRPAALIWQGKEVPLTLKVRGDHNRLNAAAAFAAGVELGVEPWEMANGLTEFAGTGRRFEAHGVRHGVRVVDDYAHHPTEVAATLRTARDVAGEGRVLVLFQPHLFSRTRDFAERFAAALDLADAVIVTDIYPAREDPMPGVTSELITARMTRGRFVADKHRAAREIALGARSGDLVITMGAGDVTELGDEIVGLL